MLKGIHASPLKQQRGPVAKFNQPVWDVAFVSAPSSCHRSVHKENTWPKQNPPVQLWRKLDGTKTEFVSRQTDSEWNCSTVLLPPAPTFFLIMCVISVIHITTFYIILCLFIFSVELCKTSCERHPLSVIECRFHVIPTRLLTWRQSVPFKWEFHLNVTWVYLNS